MGREETRVFSNHSCVRINGMVSPTLFLASNSPRRRQLLALAGWKFQLNPVMIDETPYPGEKPDSYVLRLAKTKAQAAGNEIGDAGIILAADTTVADPYGVLGKPEGPDEAIQMLRRLRGKIHQVYTALAIFNPAKGEQLSRLCCTQVTMREYLEEEILEYVASGDPLDKAGAYAIQHPGFHPVESLDGCYTNVVGMPLCLLRSMLAQAGLTGPTRVITAVCPDDANTCPLCTSLAQGEYVL